jgi:tripartite-type tricarboxylate transporter receptor subunit TctC
MSRQAKQIVQKKEDMLKIIGRLAIVAGVLAVTLPGVNFGATAQSYPARPIIMIVPFAAGGPVDVMARTVAERMSRYIGQPVVIENVLGAGGTTGTTKAMHAAADGYTIIAGNMGTHAAAVALYPNLTYDPVKDFEPIGLLASTSVMVLARKDLPPQNLREFVRYLQDNAGKVNMAHAGIGSSSHVTCLLFNQAIGVRPTMIPYSGTGPAMNALVAGEVDYMCDVITNAAPRVQAGTIKAYAIAMPRRSPVLPDVPTAEEAGMPSFDPTSWVGVFAPKRTERGILDKLSAALDKALDDPIVRKRLTDLGNDVPDSAQRGARPLGDLVRSETARWSAVLSKAAAQ